MFQFIFMISSNPTKEFAAIETMIVSCEYFFYNINVVEYDIWWKKWQPLIPEKCFF